MGCRMCDNTVTGSHRQREPPGAGTVSYTHLDVYKRQRWRKAMQDGMSLTPLSLYDGQPIYKIVYIAEHLRDLDEAKRLYQDQFVFCESNLDTCLLYTSRCV